VYHNTAWHGAVGVGVSGWSVTGERRSEWCTAGRLPARVGSGHRAGRADHAGRLSAAGTVAKIDLRLLHHPVRGLRCWLAPVRPLKSVSGDRRARVWPLRLHVSRPALPSLDGHCPLRSFELQTARAELSFQSGQSSSMFQFVNRHCGARTRTSRAKGLPRGAAGAFRCDCAC